MTSAVAGQVKPKRWRAWILPVSLGIGMILIAIAMWPPPARSEAVTVSLNGPVDAESYSIDGTGTLRSAVGADYKGRKFEETTLDVSIRRISDDGGNTTPQLSARFSRPGGGTVSCTMPRTHIWTSDEGSTETLQCSPFVEFDDLVRISSIEIVSN